ncbi:hypothetical protein BaRGS_00031928, partial [Batillaria attramentaria]
KGTFEFPELNTTVWTAKENTTITLNFRLKYSNCELPDNVTIILKKKTKESGRSADFCTIRQRNGLCRIPLVKNGCGCDGLERGLYQLKRTVNRSDNAVWIWTSADERVEDKELIFNILYIITNMTAFIGQPLQMDFPFRTHTQNETVCQLSQLAAESGTADLGPEKVDNVPSNDTGLRSGQKQMNRDSQTRNDGDVILGVGPTARATNQREPTSQHPDDYMNP